MMHLKTISAAFVALGLSAGATTASPVTITATYEATSAVGSGADHSVWISTGLGAGIGSDFDFTPAGIMTFFSDGTADLIGRVVSQGNAGAWFDLVFNYDNTFVIPPTFKSENDSVATASTFYRDLEGGTLIGGGILAGLDLSVTRKPTSGLFASQFGAGTDTNNGANNKNNYFGMATWFNITVDSDTCSICSNNSVIANLDGKQGDVNINLTPVPVPAAGLMLIGAIGALGIVRRRKRKAA